ncbi:MULTISPECIES: hypothetical protein [Alphaproteobacteria]|uniref:hypothetical protein n=1 Tax=Alphaproteobacteria TaxID=28211 RepID=UPI003297A6DA
MVNKESADAGDIARIVFRQILDGDRLKFIAQSNITDSGGGARDLRFRSWDKMEETLRKLFPGSRTEKRRRGTGNALEVYTGHLIWLQKNGKEVSKEAVLEPPTDARPNEGRITRVHEFGCFTINPPSDGSGRLIALFVQKDDGSVWPFVITERSLEHDQWNPAVAEFLLSALNAPRREGNAAYGFIDFVSGEKLVR